MNIDFKKNKLFKIGKVSYDMYDTRLGVAGAALVVLTGTRLGVAGTVLVVLTETRMGFAGDKACPDAAA